ncbi:MAG: MarR family transcriptional regulator [Planctomycetales bacterium]|nr:MarR family transcriptional regulator [Planctomycetales bacterium]
MANIWIFAAQKWLPGLAQRKPMLNVTDSDNAILDLLRRRQNASIGEMQDVLGVTATAVRQRVNRLLALGLIQRKRSRNDGPGRPGHEYSLTDSGHKTSGANFADLAIALWTEIRELKDPEVRRGLLQRISARLAEKYRTQIGDGDLSDRMKSVAELFGERHVPCDVQECDTSGLPVLTVLACPYPTLAEQDRTVCSMEKMLMSELLGESVALSRCRLDGEACCTFEVSSP